MSKWVSFPMIHCPKCGKEFQVEEYYFLDKDSSIECQYCEVEIFILELDTVIQARIGLESDKEVEI